jgi:hypothetical protein
MFLGIVHLSDFQNLSDMEIIKNTAEYLLCLGIVKVSQKIIESAKNEVDAVKEQNLKLNTNKKQVTNSSSEISTRVTKSFTRVTQRKM